MLGSEVMWQILLLAILFWYQESSASRGQCQKSYDSSLRKELKSLLAEIKSGKVNLDSYLEKVRENQNRKLAGSEGGFLSATLQHFSVKTATLVTHNKNVKRSGNLMKQLTFTGIASNTWKAENFLEIGQFPNAFIFLGNAKLFQTTLQMLASKGYFGKTRTLWLLEASDPELEFKDINIPINSKVFVHKSISEAGHLELLEVYRVDSSSPLIVQAIGIWSPNFGLIMTKVSFWMRRSNLWGKVFTGATIEDPPYSIVHRDKFLGQEHITITGLFADMWKEFERRSNFSTKLVYSIDDAWGILQDNGQFNGIVGMLQRKEVDVSVTSLTIYKDRSEVVDHLDPYSNYRHELFVKASSGNSNPTMTFIRPFNPWLWAALLFTGILCCIIFQILSKIVLKGDHDVSFAMILFFHGLCSQGVSNEPEDRSRRIVFLLLFFVGLVNVNCYSATLTSFLAVKQVTLPFTDKASLLANEDYTLLMVGGTFQEDIFMNGNELEQKLYNEKTETASTFGEAMERFETEPHMAFFNTKDGVKLTLEKRKELCNFRMVPAFSVSTWNSIYAQKDWPYRDLFNYHIQNMKESGMIQKLIMKWTEFSDESQCNAASETLEPMSISTVSSALVFLVLAVALCSLILIAEFNYKPKGSRPLSIPITTNPSHQGSPITETMS